jgi:hypothetical protein
MIWQKLLIKSKVDYDLGIVIKRNQKINAENIISTSSSDFSRLTEEDINMLVRGLILRKRRSWPSFYRGRDEQNGESRLHMGNDC